MEDGRYPRTGAQRLHGLPLRTGTIDDVQGDTPWPLELVRLQGKNRYETLLKSGRIDHFRHFMMHSTDLEICW